MKVKTRNFTQYDLERSDTAKQKGINNSIPGIYLYNTKMLLNYLQNIRDAYGKPINVNSGYRSPALNRAVGGSRRSSHLYCLAADIRPNYTEDFDEFVEFIKDYMKDKEFDQCIIERSGNARWVHIGIDHPEFGKRKQLFGMVVQ